ncbi:MAG: TauD/TfdA family dioxygenase [Magnetococcales bacterium]|nr:TauD/TfdA family dioxygenase [Magnetococcales bacterium]
MNITKDTLKTLRDQGWARIPSNVHEVDALEARTLEIAQRLGTPVRGRVRSIVEVLRPTAPEAAHPASLSRKYGLDAFPFHVDTAHWTVPARFLILSCVSPGEESVPTLLANRDDLHMSDEEQAVAKSAVFLVRNGRNSFYSSIFISGRDFVRYDPGCMEPQCQDAIRALAFFSRERVMPYVEKIDWQPGESLIIDNWRVLHARDAVNQNAINRLLFRCLVV